MGLFEETILVIGIIVGVIGFLIFIIWSFAKANSHDFESDHVDTKKYKKESEEISTKLDKLKETTDQDEALPKGFKEDNHGS